jgi:hypothetical protein
MAPKKSTAALELAAAAGFDSARIGHDLTARERYLVARFA